jgi:hypothetical protein
MHTSRPLKKLFIIGAAAMLGVSGCKEKSPPVTPGAETASAEQGPEENV